MQIDAKNLECHRAAVNGINMHYMLAGPDDGPPVVLLHGWPETSYAWRKQMPTLAQKYRLIVPDLRGYGSTDKPATGYDKRNMALDYRPVTPGVAGSNPVGSAILDVLRCRGSKFNFSWLRSLFLVVCTGLACQWRSVVQI